MKDQPPIEVSDIMTPDPVPASSDTSLDEALRIMDEHDIRHLPVLEDGKLVGVISDRDLLEATGWLPARVHGARGPRVSAALPKTIGDILHADVVTTAPDASVVDAAIEFIGRAIGCLPVVRDGELVGMVTELDMVRAYARACSRGGLPGDVDTPVSEHMSLGAITVEWNATLEEATAICHSIAARHLPVVERGRLVGVVSDRDLRRAVGVGRRDETPVEEIMTRDVLSIPPEAAMSQAARTMSERKISCLPVIEGDELIGILTMTDVLDHSMSALRDRRAGLARAEVD